MAHRFIAALVVFSLIWASGPLQAAQLVSSLPTDAGYPRAVSPLIGESFPNASLSDGPAMLSPGQGLLAPGLTPETPFETVSTLAASKNFETGASSSYDGKRALKADSGGVEAAPSQPETPLTLAGNSPQFMPQPPPAPRKNAPKPSRFPWFRAALTLGMAAAVIGPILSRAVPVDYLSFSGLLPLGIIGFSSLNAGLRALLRVPRKPPAIGTQSAKSALLALGLISGIAIGSSATIFKADIVERQSTAAEHTQRLSPAIAEEATRAISQSEEGRQLLEELKDVFGVLRTPTFFISNLDRRLATYNSVTNAVTIDRNAVTGHGWTNEQFLKDAALQRQLINEIAPSMVHELRHNEQFKRSLTPSWFKSRVSMEIEYEAYTTQMIFAHQMLGIDPHAGFSRGEMDYYESMIADYDGFLKKMDAHPAYAGIGHIDTPYYRSYFAKIRAGMPQMSVEGYVLLAKRALPDDPGKARSYLQKAQERAAANDLPRPELAIPAEN